MSDEKRPLTRREQQVLDTITDHPEWSLQQIGDHIGVTRERVRQLSSRLEMRGLIESRKQARQALYRSAKADRVARRKRWQSVARQYRKVRHRQKLRKMARLDRSGVARNYLMPGLNAVCSFMGCNHPIDARGYCRKHYSMLRRSGVLWVERTTRDSCLDCGEIAYARGYCQYHYGRHLQKGDLEAIQDPKTSQSLNSPTRVKYPRIEQRNNRWILFEQSQGAIFKRTFFQKADAEQALARLQRTRK